MHHRNYVHGDLKGANMLLGLGKSGASQVYLVDFGLCTHYTTAEEFKPDPKNMHNGTIEYTSRDAHCGVPTMRSDLEVLAYNLITWFGFLLPWESGKLLENPVKVHEAKKAFMKDVEKSLKTVFGTSPVPVVKFFNYINTLEFNEAPNYLKCRQFFETGLKTMGKTNTGELVFKNASPSPKKTVKKTAQLSDKKLTSPAAQKRSKAKPTEVLVSESEDDCPVKKPRVVKPQISPKKGQTPNKKTARTSEQENFTPSGETEGSLNVNNGIQSRGKKNGKTYEFNFELDVSIDANVVINVKRKKDTSKARNSPISQVADKPNKKQSTRIKQEPIDSACEEEIAASPNSTPVASMRLVNREKEGGRKRAGTTPVTSVRKIQRL